MDRLGQIQHVAIEQNAHGVGGMAERHAVLSFVVSRFNDLCSAGVPFFAAVFQPVELRVGFRRFLSVGDAAGGDVAQIPEDVFRKRIAGETLQPADGVRVGGFTREALLAVEPAAVIDDDLLRDDVGNVVAEAMASVRMEMEAMREEALMEVRHGVKLLRVFGGLPRTVVGDVVGTELNQKRKIC